MAKKPAVSQETFVDYSGLCLLDLIPALAPHMRRPDHMGEWAGKIEATITRRVLAMCAYPTRHWKTTVTIYGVIWILLRRPSWRVLVICNEFTRAQWYGRQIRLARDRAGIKAVDGIDTIQYWQTEQGGGVTVMGREQSAIGYDADIVIADDPIDENGFGDPLIREQVDDVINFYTLRAGGNGRLGSVLLVMSRGHLDDPFGRRLKRVVENWEAFSASAIMCGECSGRWPCEMHPDVRNERAFAPDVWPLLALQQKRAEEFERDPSLATWESQWMANPLAFADGFFEGQTPYTGPLPPDDAEIVIGLDCAFTQGKKSDYFAAVCMSWIVDRLVIFHVVRHRRGLADAIRSLLELKARFQNARFFSYTSGPEIGVYHGIYELTQGKIVVECMPARWNKATRASKTAEAWRDRRLPVVLGQPWSGPYLTEMHSFGGGEVGVDDQVDATVSGYDAAMMNRPDPSLPSGFLYGSFSV